MSEDMTSTGDKDRRGYTQKMVNKLLEERAQMLVLYYRAAGLDPETHKEPLEKPIQEFCQLLVDYIAAGHFTVYERIINRQERRQRVVEVADEIYSDIAATTTSALDFNDKYENPEMVRHSAQLSKDLSSLGEQLALRIELEDKLLKLLR